MFTSLLERGLTRAILVGAMLSTVAVLTGCSNDEQPTGTGGGSVPIMVDEIIINPKAPAPGDTVRVTAVVTATSTNPGDFVTYTWTASAGTLLETDLSSVRWVAPASSGVHSVSVTAKNSVSTSSNAANMFAGNLVDIILLEAGELNQTSTGDSIFYLSSALSPDSDNFAGFRLRLLDTMGDMRINASTAGTEYTFTRDFQYAAHVRDGAINQKTIIVDELAMGTQRNLQPGPFQTIRRPEFTEPYFSPDAGLLTYQAFLPDQAGTGLDTFDVYLYDMISRTETNLTLAGKGFHPTFSSDGNHLVFVSDRTGPVRWELFALPVENGSVPVDSIPGKLLQLTDTGGLMGSLGSPPADRRKQWNPNPMDPILAITDSDSKLRLVPTSGAGAIAVAVAGRVTDLRWAPDGQSLVMSTTATSTSGEAIHVVTKTGAPTRIFEALRGLGISGLSWSANGDFVTFAITRSGDRWYELIDMSGVTGLTGSIPITSVRPRGDIEDYSELMSVRPAWSPSADVVSLLFFDGATPRASSLDVSGLIP